MNSKDLIGVKTKSDLERKKLEVELKAAEELAKIKEAVIEKRLQLELVTLDPESVETSTQNKEPETIETESINQTEQSKNNNQTDPKSPSPKVNSLLMSKPIQIPQHIQVNPVFQPIDPPQTFPFHPDSQALPGAAVLTSASSSAPPLRQIMDLGKRSLNVPQSPKKRSIINMKIRSTESKPKVYTVGLEPDAKVYGNSNHFHDQKTYTQKEQQTDFEPEPEQPAQHSSGLHGFAYSKSLMKSMFNKVKSKVKAKVQKKE